VGVGDVLDLPEYVAYVQCNSNAREDIYADYGQEQ
jgi:hypothetical protein